MMATAFATLCCLVLAFAFVLAGWLAHAGGPRPLRGLARVALAIGLVFSIFVAWGVHDMARAQDRSGTAPGAGDHGFKHPENHDWYRDLKQPGTGYSCCNGSTVDAEGDCRPTRAYQDPDDKSWHALVDGRWISVPPRVVLEQLAPDGRSHICANRSGLIYCFLRGSPKS